MSMEEARANASADLSEPGFHKIAWAFLKVRQNVKINKEINKMDLFGYVS